MLLFGSEYSILCKISSNILNKYPWLWNSVSALISNCCDSGSDFLLADLRVWEGRGLGDRVPHHAGRLLVGPHHHDHGKWWELTQGSYRTVFGSDRSSRSGNLCPSVYPLNDKHSIIIFFAQIFNVQEHYRAFGVRNLEPKTPLLLGWIRWHRTHFASWQSDWRHVRHLRCLGGGSPHPNYR